MAEPGIFEILYSTRAMRRLKPDPIPEALPQRSCRGFDTGCEMAFWMAGWLLK